MRVTDRQRSGHFQYYLTVCSARFAEFLLPSAFLPWFRKRYRVGRETEKQLLAMSARQMDRRLRGRKWEQKQRIYGGTKPGAAVEAPHSDKNGQLGREGTWVREVEGVFTFSLVVLQSR